MGTSPTSQTLTSTFHRAKELRSQLATIAGKSLITANMSSAAPEELASIAAQLRNAVKTAGNDINLGVPFAQHANTLDGFTYIVSSETPLPRAAVDTLNRIGVDAFDASRNMTDVRFKTLAAMIERGDISLSTSDIVETFASARNVVGTEKGGVGPANDLYNALRQHTPLGV